MFSKSKSTSNGAGTLSPERRQAKIEKRRRFWRKARRGLLWMLALLVVAHLSLNIYASVQLNRELASIKAKGEPLRFSDLEPPSVPDAQNAALVYQRANKTLHLSTDAQEALRTRSNNLSPQLEKALADALRTNQGTIALIRQGASLPQCYFPINWNEDPIKTTFPQYAYMRQLASLVAADARMQARSGNREVALSDIRALFGMTRHLSHEPTLIGFLVALSVDSTATRTLGQISQMLALSVPQAHALNASLASSDWPGAFRYSLLSERTFEISAFESLARGQSVYINPGDDDGSFTLPEWMRSFLLTLAHPVLKMDQVQMLRIWRQVLDSPDSRQIPAPVSLGQRESQAIENAPFYAILTKILFPVFVRVDQNRDRAIVRRRQRVVVLALNCYRSARGHYPASLQEVASLWGSALPSDLYGSKPFVYKSDGKTFTLYSIGANRTDDGGNDPFLPGYGRTNGPTLHPRADDIVWLYP